MNICESSGFGQLVRNTCVCSVPCALKCSGLLVASEDILLGYPMCSTERLYMDGGALQFLGLNRKGINEKDFCQSRGMGKLPQCCQRKLHGREVGFSWA